MIYVEKSTRAIYEASFFEDFILVRPASPAFYDAIRKVTMKEFGDEFDEYYGLHSEVIKFLHGDDNPEVEVNYGRAN